MKKIILSAALSVLFMMLSWQTSAQINMSNTAQTTCSSTYYDENGSAGDYDKDDFTQTFTPSTSCSQLRFVFTAWNIADNGDILTIYNGPNTSSPVIGTYTIGTPPGTITSSNPTGQLTFDWVANNSGYAAGWAATISCISSRPCASAITMNCGTTYSATLGTTCSDWSTYTSCSYTEPGDEQVYAYTPAITASYTFTTTTISGDPDFFLMSTCGNTGTNLAGGCWGSGNKTVALTAGVTYYIIADNYSSSATASYSVSVNCCCSGTPPAGTTTASPSVLTCPAQAVSLSTSIGDVCGYTYQWQSSTDNISYTNISGATNPTHTVYPTSDQYYRLRVTCTVSGLSNTTTGAFVSVSGTAPANDDPCNATTLIVNNGSCMYTTATNNCGSASEVADPSIPAPGCSSYGGEDVWFKVTVPASRRLVIDMDDNGGLTDMGMALYTGTCSNLSLLECDDDDSQNGSMPMICRTGTLCTVPGDCAQNNLLTAGATVWIRVWDYSGNEMGTFDICAYDPGPAGTPSTCANATVISSIPYSATGLTTCCKADDYDATDGCASTYQGGEDYLFSFTPTANQSIDITLSGTTTYTGVFVTDRCPSNNSANCIGQGTSTSGNPSVCGVALSAGTTYYIMVDTEPGPTCTSFNINITSSSAPTCGLNYSVSTIAYSATNMSGSTPISLPIDDRFSPSYIPIGFNFCYDGIGYTQLLVSSNAYLIFDAIGCATNLPSSNAVPGGSSAWSINIDAPNTTEMPRNSIMFPWHDTDPNDGGTISYKLTGTSPNRIFVVEYNNVAMFGSSCTSYTFSGQVKLFETSNNIEIHLANKDICTAWNDGAAIMGLTNFNGNLSVIPSGCNYSAAWSASNDAWRFTCNCTDCITLPVEFLSFSGSHIAPGVNRLEWETATETNNDFFEIQRKNENDDFVKIAEQNGAGNSNQQLQYSYTDNEAGSGVSYYRLRQVDFNGNNAFSSIIAVGEFPEIVGFNSVFPNPATEEITVQLTSDGTPIRLVLVAAGGQEFILDEQFSFTGATSRTYHLDNVPPGVYLLKADNEKSEYFFKEKIVVQ